MRQFPPEPNIITTFLGAKVRNPERYRARRHLIDHRGGADRSHPRSARGSKSLTTKSSRSPLYRGGLREARRVLRPNGQVWVKCQDEIESGRQCWSHIEIRAIARKLGFKAKDLFIGFASVSILIWTFHNNVQVQAECN